MHNNKIKQKTHLSTMNKKQYAEKGNQTKDAHKQKKTNNNNMQKKIIKQKTHINRNGQQHNNMQNKKNKK